VDPAGLASGSSQPPPLDGVVLEVDGLGVSYGGVVALSDVSFTLCAGEILGLIGPNGAGKTTTIDALTGFVVHRGTVQVNGVDISRRSPHERVGAGLVRTWQAVELFEDLTVAEHLAVAAPSAGVRDVFSDILNPRRRTSVQFDRAGHSDAEILERLDLSDVAGSIVGDLSQGTQKLVGVARALASRPEVLLLDEPAAGLDAEESRAFGDRLRSLVDEGLSIVLVDHDVELVMAICDSVVVLDFGSVIAAGSPAVIRNDLRVQEAYLGVAAEPVRNQPDAAPEDAVDAGHADSEPTTGGTP